MVNLDGELAATALGLCWGVIPGESRWGASCYGFDEELYLVNLDGELAATALGLCWGVIPDESRWGAIEIHFSQITHFKGIFDKFWVLTLIHSLLIMNNLKSIICVDLD